MKFIWKLELGNWSFQRVALAKGEKYSDVLVEVGDIHLTKATEFALV